MTHTSTPVLRRAITAEWLLYAGYAALLALACLGPHVPQAAHYHDFADQRALWGLHNALDVLSNLPFALIGALGLWRGVLQAPVAVRASGARPWLALVSGGLLLTAVGSSYYHLAPDDWRVFWDRMGMVPVFAGVLALALQSVLSQRAAVVTALLVLVMGPVSLWMWLQTGQLLPWAVLQGAGMVLLLVVALWQRFSAASVRSSTGLLVWPWGAVVAWYAVAKVLELGDTLVWSISHHLVAGHALKHVAAALALVPLLLMVQRVRNAERQPVPVAGTIRPTLVQGPQP